jgi:drug/metabolite transporter (DMT)-like permease
MIFLVIMSIIFIILAVIFLMGKGDKLIAGYNTASEEEKSKVNIKRLRLLMAIICVITAGFLSIQPIIESNRATQMGAFFAFILVTMVFIILANTWAKKK